jgi:hypothetical protein
MDDPRFPRAKGATAHFLMGITKITYDAIMHQQRASKSTVKRLRHCYGTPLFLLNKQPINIHLQVGLHKVAPLFDPGLIFTPFRFNKASYQVTTTWQPPHLA